MLCVLQFSLPAWALAQEKAADETYNVEEIIKETQKSISDPKCVGLIWWIPTEFWEQAAQKHGTPAEQAHQTFGALRQYTVIGVAVGRLGLGNINWYNEQIIRSSVALKDSEGAVYAPLTDLSPDAAGLVSIFKPVLSNILGPMGQNFQLLFFPSQTSKGKLIADPHHEGAFTVDFSYPQEKIESQHDWKLPLTSLSPPKYCPVGKERVQANWKYCPWHGNKLDSSPPATVPQPASKRNPQ